MKKLNSKTLAYVAKTYGKKFAEGGEAGEDEDDIEETSEAPQTQAASSVPAGYDTSPEANPNVAITPDALDQAGISSPADLNQPVDPSASAAASDWTTSVGTSNASTEPTAGHGYTGSWDTPTTAGTAETPTSAAVEPAAQKYPGVQGAMEEEKSANTQGAEAQAQQGQAEVQALKDFQNNFAKLPSANDIAQQYKAKDDALFQAYQSKKLDPNRVLHNATTPQKFSTGIALILGGIGGGLTHQPNLAAQMLEDSINRDIDAQKNDQGNQLNLWKMNKEEYGNDVAANAATQNQLLTGLKSQLMQAASAAKGPMAQANANHANALIDQQMAQNRFKISLMQPTSDSFGIDPAKKVPFLVPPAQQAKVFDEIDAAQNTTRNAQGIVNAFDQAAKEVRPATAVQNRQLPSGTAFIPGAESANQKAFHALMGPTFKDVDGTVRQAAMDNMFHSTTPQFGDSDQTIQTKRDALVGYLTSKSSAPNASGFGINLGQYPSTNVKAALPVPMDSVQQEKVQAFMKSNPQVKSSHQAVQILQQAGRW